MDVVITPSGRSDKRLQAKFENKVVHFGARGGSTYIDHKDPKVKTNWEKRHRARENWKDYDTAGALSKHVLWNKTNIRESVRDLNRKQTDYKFKVKQSGY